MTWQLSKKSGGNRLKSAENCYKVVRNGRICLKNHENCIKCGEHFLKKRPKKVK